MALPIRREADVQAGVVTYARSLRIIARKLDFGEGWPDYMFLYRGRVLFIEFKREGETRRPLQVAMGASLVEEGFWVAVIDSEEMGKHLIKEFYRGNRHYLATFCRGNNPNE